MDATYTAEQLREDAHRADGIGTMADGDQLRAHADALEENARLRAELGKFSDRNGYALRQRAERAEAQLAERDAEIAALKGHAEDMASVLGRIQRYRREDVIYQSYRAAYPKE